MDDTPEKLRRNVMLISSLIACMMIFDLTLKTSGAILGFVEIGNVSPIKIWLSLSIALAYFFLRYYFSEQVKIDLKSMKTDYINLKIKNAIKTLHKIINTYFTTGNHPEWLPKLLPVNVNVFPTKSSFFKLRKTALDDSCASGTTSIAYKVIAHNGQEFHSNADDIQHEFFLSKTQRLYILIKSGARTAIISKATADVFVPFSLAGCAALICIFKLVTLYLTHSAGN